MSVIAAKKSGGRLNLSMRITGILFLLPASLFVLFTIFVPAGWNLLLSFQQWDGFNPATWVGLRNYREALQDSVARESLYHSVYLAVVSSVFAVLIGILLAAFVYRLGRREGAVYRLILFMPAMLPLAIIGLLFAFIYNPEMGLINQFLKLIGAGSLADAWLENRSTVMNAIAIVGIWRISGLTMMLCFAAMQNIPHSLFESSKLDGAGYAKQFVYIVLPLIKPIIRLSAVFTIIVQFKTYDLVFVMTAGGPGTASKTIPLHMVDVAFSFNEFGLSSALGFLLTAAVIACILAANRLLKGEQHEY